jgi:co-chaperonin GroES (HSP10)
MLKEVFSSVQLINSVLIRISKSEERYTQSGLFIPVDDKPTNYGLLLKKSSFVTKEFENFNEVLNSMDEGCTVFFNAKATYNVIELDVGINDNNSKYLIVPLDQIQAFSVTPKG